jgi:hypothetical protein
MHIRVHGDIFLIAFLKVGTSSRPTMYIKDRRYINAFSSTKAAIATGCWQLTRYRQ